MFLHDIIKIQLTRYGYLMNYPYHMISDAEMCDAFMSDDGVGYFYDTYPRIDGIGADLESVYDTLELSIRYHLHLMKSAPNGTYQLPNWVYSYMLGAVVSVHSDPLDIHDLLVPLNIDNTDDIFTADACRACHEISKQWIRKIALPEYVEWDGKSVDLRPPTLFGEPHVIKSIRLSQVPIV